MKIGMSTACFFMREDTEKAVMEISRMGIKRCEIFLSGFSEYKRSFFDELVRITRGEGMHCSAIHALSMQFEPQLFSKHARQHQDALQEYNRILDGAERLQAECYVMHGYFTLKNDKKSPDFPRIGQRLVQLSDMAAQRDVRLTLENVHYCMYNQMGVAERLEPFIDGSALGYTLDLKQAVRSGRDPLDYMEEMGGRLANIHICGLSAINAEAPTCMPEYSKLDNLLFANKLKATGYSGSLTLEVYPSDYKDYSELKKSMDYLDSVYG